MKLHHSILFAVVLTVGCGQSSDGPPTSNNNTSANDPASSNANEPSKDTVTTLVSFNVPGMT